MRILQEYEKYRPGARRTNFFYSFRFLPREKREAIYTVYTLFRCADDLVDEYGAGQLDYQQYELLLQKREKLAQLRREIERTYAGEATHPLFRSLRWVVNRFSIPKQYFLTLFDGIEQDLFVTRYETFEDLKAYCYSVASIVGLIVIEILGYKYEETKSYAVNLGYALQLTNILRDIKPDKDRGRIYVPLEDLRSFGYSVEDLHREVYNDAFIELMRFEVHRARQFYHQARSMLRSDEQRSLVVAQIMDHIYYRLLEKIELSDYNIFRRRIAVSLPHKILIALHWWLKAFVLWK